MLRYFKAATSGLLFAFMFGYGAGGCGGDQFTIGGTGPEPCDPNCPAGSGGAGGISGQSGGAGDSGGLSGKSGAGGLGGASGSAGKNTGGKAGTSSGGSSGSSGSGGNPAGTGGSGGLSGKSGAGGLGGTSGSAGNCCPQGGDAGAGSDAGAAGDSGSAGDSGAAGDSGSAGDSGAGGDSGAAGDGGTGGSPTYDCSTAFIPGAEGTLQQFIVVAGTDLSSYITAHTGFSPLDKPHENPLSWGFTDDGSLKGPIVGVFTAGDKVSIQPLSKLNEPRSAEYFEANQTYFTSIGLTSDPHSLGYRQTIEKYLRCKENVVPIPATCPSSIPDEAFTKFGKFYELNMIFPTMTKVFIAVSRICKPVP